MFQTKFDGDAKIWSGKKLSPIFNANISVGEALLWSLLKDPQKIGQISENNGIQLTKEEIRLKTIRAAQNLLQLGVQKGDVFGIVARNSHHLAPIVFAAMSIGCPINPLDPSFGKGEIVHMFGITKPKLIFCDQDIVDVMRESLDEIGIAPQLYTFDGPTEYSKSVDDLLVSTDMETKFIPVQLDDGTQHTAAIVCSSGTTGRPKGICLSHATLLSGIAFQSTMPEVALCFSSIYWFSGLGMLISATLLGAKRLITTNPFSPDRCLRMIEKYQVNYLFSPTYQMALMLRHDHIKATDMNSVRILVVGGSYVADDLRNEMQKFIPKGLVIIGYGLTEMAGAIAGNAPPKPGAVGLLFKNMQVKIIDDDGNQCGVNESGEIYIKCPYKFLGYYCNEEMTRNAFDGDGWFMTGDIGQFDEEGYLFYVDRKKDILKYCNYQISPSEIESLLMEHPAIAEVCVVGVPDPICTDLPAAVIVLKDNVQLTVEEVQEFIEDKLTDFKKLRGGVYFVDSLPMTPSCKYLKRAVKEIVIQLYAVQKKGTTD